MQQALLYLIYFLVGGIGTVLVAYFNTSGKSGIGALISTMPIHFLTNVLIAALVAGPAVAIGFSRMSLVTNVAWLAGVLAFAVAYQYTHNLWIAVIVCAAISLIATLSIDYVCQIA